jgi:hypothetical protein
MDNGMGRPGDKVSFTRKLRSCSHGLPSIFNQAAGWQAAGFVSLLNSLTPVMAKHGWKLLGSYASVVGRLNTVVDLWELPNEAAIQAAV